MQRRETQSGNTTGSLECRQLFQFEPAASSDRLGWVSLGAAHCGLEPAFERVSPAIPHHRLVLNARPPDELDLQYDGVKRHRPHPAGSVVLIPAGRRAWVRSSGHRDELHVFLDPGLVARVAEEEFDLDPARLEVPPLDGLDLPHLRAGLGAVKAELMEGRPGGHLAAESLANLLSVYLLRYILEPRQPVRRSDGVLPRKRLQAVVGYIEERLASELTLAQLAAVAQLSPYHFARVFKATTGLPPHQFVIARRVERARELLRDGNPPLAEVALCTGFSDQSQLSRHFKRVVGVAPGRFRRTAEPA
jgi:AraC family transcriptional regulator